MAVGAPSLDDPRYLRAVIDVAVRGLPHAYRDLAAAPGDSVALDIRGVSGGQWTVMRDAGRWELSVGVLEAPTTTVVLTDDAAWQLLFNALSPADAARAVSVAGQADLAAPLLRARSVVV